MEINLSTKSEESSRVMGSLQELGISRQLIMQTLRCRYYPFTFVERSQELIAQATHCANECERWANQIREYSKFGLSSTPFKLSFEGEENLARTYRLRYQRHSSFATVVEYMRKIYGKFYLVKVEETPVERFYPFTIELSSPVLEKIAHRCARECDSWASELREYVDRMISLESVTRSAEFSGTDTLLEATGQEKGIIEKDEVQEIDDYLDDIDAMCN